MGTTISLHRGWAGPRRTADLDINGITTDRGVTEVSEEEMQGRPCIPETGWGSTAGTVLQVTTGIHTDVDVSQPEGENRGILATLQCYSPYLPGFRNYISRINC